MIVKNRLNLEMEDFGDDCYVSLKNDCPLGKLFDYSCALQKFVLDRMHAATEAQKQKNETDIKPAEK